MAAVSANLGHSNLSTTANIYTHIFKTPTQASKGIAKTIDALEIPCQIGDKSDNEKALEH